jgi:dihydroorotate dehydrogenase electron transfer subunit
MKQGIFTIIENVNLTADIMKMRLSGDTTAITAPGQFVNIKIKGLFLRRPISVCDCENGELTIIYRVVGEGTKAMSEMESGDCLDILTGLGNGYDLTCAGNNPLLIGGGVGIPPLYLLAKKLISKGVFVKVIMGVRSKAELFYVKEFESLGATVIICTADGSEGIKGFVTDALNTVGEYTYVYTCGPEPMLKAVYEKTVTSGQYSFEERMGCGFGACMGCTCKTLYGNKRICKDGPVLVKEEIRWEA